MRSQRQVVALLVEAKFRRPVVAQARGELLKDLAWVEAALLLVGQRHVVHRMLVKADDQRRDPAASGHIVERDDLEADPLGGRERRHQLLELGGLADDGDRLTRLRLQRQRRLRGLPRGFGCKFQLSLCLHGWRKNRRRRHGAPVPPGRRYSSRETAKSEIRQDGARRVGPVIVGRATTEVELDVDGADDGGHFLAQQGLFAELFQQLLDFWRGQLLAIGNQVLDRAVLLYQLDGGRVADTPNARDVVRDIAHQDLEINGLDRLKAVSLSHPVRRVAYAPRYSPFACQ